MDKSVVLPVAAGAAFAVLCGWFLVSVSPAAAPVAAKYEASALEGFAVCLADKGAKMYGAVWCSHCQAQKAEFGAAFSAVPYVECSVAGNPNAQAPACASAGVTGYPTWTFKDGTRLEGGLPFAILAYKTGCREPLPLGAAVNLTGSAAQR